jgi:hypothetical protein
MSNPLVLHLAPHILKAKQAGANINLTKGCYARTMSPKIELHNNYEMLAAHCAGPAGPIDPLLDRRKDYAFVIIRYFRIHPEG